MREDSVADPWHGGAIITFPLLTFFVPFCVPPSSIADGSIRLFVIPGSCVRGLLKSPDDGENEVSESFAMVGQTKNTPQSGHCQPSNLLTSSCNGRVHKFPKVSEGCQF